MVPRQDDDRRDVYGPDESPPMAGRRGLQSKSPQMGDSEGDAGQNELQFYGYPSDCAQAASSLVRPISKMDEMFSAFAEDLSENLDQELIQDLMTKTGSLDAITTGQIDDDGVSSATSLLNQILNLKLK